MKVVFVVLSCLLILICHSQAASKAISKQFQLPKVQFQQKMVANTQTNQQKLSKPQTNQYSSRKIQLNQNQTRYTPTSQPKKNQSYSYSFDQSKPNRVLNKPQINKSQTQQLRQLHLQSNGSQISQTPISQTIKNKSQNNQFQAKQPLMMQLPLKQSQTRQKQSKTSQLHANKNQTRPTFHIKSNHAQIKLNSTQSSRKQLKQTVHNPVRLQHQVKSQHIINLQINPYETQLSNRPHAFEMTAVYTKQLQLNPKFSLVKRFFSIGAAYFRRVLKVTPLPQNFTKYRNSQRCGQIFAPNFVFQGFNQSTTDIIILVGDQSQQTDVTISAVASLCDFMRRPTYGRISYSTQKIMPDNPLNISQFIHVTIHEMMHILVFTDFHLHHFYTCPTSNSIRPYNEVVKCDQKDCFVITPKVKEYVKNYFNCSDGKTGGMLYLKTKNHWSLQVYRDELMIPWMLYIGAKITGLTLALLEDSGYYASVDLSYAQLTTFGMGKGCQFAQGIIPTEDRCKPQTCNLEHRFGRLCKQIQGNQIMERGYANLICENPLLTTLSEDYYYFGNSSR